MNSNHVRLGTEQRPVRIRFTVCCAGMIVFTTIQILASPGLNASWQQPSHAGPVGGPENPDSIVALCEQIYETLNAHQFSPPTRQQFALVAAQTARELAGVDHDYRLKNEIESLAEPDDIRQWLTRQVEIASRDGADLNPRIIAARIVRRFDPDTAVLSGKEAAISGQIRENRYVGIGIVIRYADGFAVIEQAFPGGAACVAGAKSGDIILEVDDRTMDGLDLGEVVDRLRGSEGTNVSVKLRNEKEEETRRLEMTRAVVPIPSVTGTEQNDDGSWEFVYPDQPDMAILSLTSLSGSTASELSTAASKLRLANVDRVILNLAGVTDGELHHVHLVADALCGPGHFLTLVHRDGERQTLNTGEENPFADMKMAVLVPDEVSGPVLALVNRLANRPNTKLVGNIVRSDLACHAIFEFPDGTGAIAGVRYAMVDLESLELPELKSPDSNTGNPGIAVLMADIQESDNERQIRRARRWLNDDES